MNVPMVKTTCNCVSDDHHTIRSNGCFLLFRPHAKEPQVKSKSVKVLPISQFPDCSVVKQVSSIWNIDQFAFLVFLFQCRLVVGSFHRAFVIVEHDDSAGSLTGINNFGMVLGPFLDDEQWFFESRLFALIRDLYGAHTFTKYWGHPPFKEIGIPSSWKCPLPGDNNFEMFNRLTKSLPKSGKYMTPELREEMIDIIRISHDASKNALLYVKEIERMERKVGVGPEDYEGLACLRETDEAYRDKTICLKIELCRLDSCFEEGDVALMIKSIDKSLSRVHASMQRRVELHLQDLRKNHFVDAMTRKAKRHCVCRQIFDDKYYEV